MTDIQRNIAREILQKCRTLADAEEKLERLKPMLSVAARWGLWDGWSGRPRTDAGLKERDRADYREACEIGRELSLREVPQ